MIGNEKIDYYQLSVCLTHVAHGLLVETNGEWSATLETKPWTDMSPDERIELVKKLIVRGTHRDKIGDKEVQQFVYRMSVFEQKEHDGNPIVVAGKIDELKMVAYTIYRLLRLAEGDSFSILRLQSHISALTPNKAENRTELNRLVSAFIMDSALEFLHP